MVRSKNGGGGGGGGGGGIVHIKVILVPQKIPKAVRRGCNQNP